MYAYDPSSEQLPLNGAPRSLYNKLTHCTAGQQEIQHKLQSNNRGRLPHKRGHGRRPNSDHAGTSLFQLELHPMISSSTGSTSLTHLSPTLALGHRRPRALPIPGRRLLPRRRLLRPRLRRQHAQILRNTRLLARRIPHPSLAAGPRVLPLRRPGQQGRRRRR
jgi:hypothetical protein